MGVMKESFTKLNHPKLLNKNIFVVLWISSLIEENIIKNIGIFESSE